MEVLNKYFINLFAQSSGRIATICANFFVFVLVARIGGTELFGQYSYVLAFFGIFAAIADFGMTDILAKDFAQAQHSRDVYIIAFSRLTLL